METDTQTDLSATLQGLTALSQDIRLRTFRMLMSAEPEGLPAGSISTALGVAPNKLSAHLNILLRAGLIKVERIGRNMIYSADVDAVGTLLTRLVETCCNDNPDLCKQLNSFSKERCC